MNGPTSYSIGTLAEAAGVSRRTVRFYVQRDLLPPPAGLGRGAHYTGEHLARLLEIKAWQEHGVPLDEIRRRVSASPAPPSPEPLRVLGDAGGGRRLAHLPPPVAAPSGQPRSSAALFPQVPGHAWFRQPLVAGVELHVAIGKTPLTARQLAALAAALNDILEKGDETE